MVSERHLLSRLRPQQRVNGPHLMIVLSCLAAVGLAIIQIQSCVFYHLSRRVIWMPPRLTGTDIHALSTGNTTPRPTYTNRARLASQLALGSRSELKGIISSSQKPCLSLVPPPRVLPLFVIRHYDDVYERIYAAGGIEIIFDFESNGSCV